jgi:hypothetical protein
MSMGKRFSRIFKKDPKNVPEIPASASTPAPDAPATSHNCPQDCICRADFATLDRNVKKLQTQLQNTPLATEQPAEYRHCARIAAVAPNSWI